MSSICPETRGSGYGVWKLDIHERDIVMLLVGVELMVDEFRGILVFVCGEEEGRRGPK